METMEQQVNQLCRDLMRHPEHMCSLTKNGCAGEIARLGQDPHFVCKVCGERSHACEYLCTPAIIGA